MEKNEIFIIYGNDIEEMAVRLAEEADLAGLIGDRGKKIGLKPNLVNAKPADYGSTTHPEIAAGLIKYLKKKGFNNLAILEGSWTGGSTAEAFDVCGYRKIAEEMGVKLIDTKKDKARKCDCAGLQLEICESVFAIDYMINLPVLKGHCQTRLTCALKNNKGVIPDSEKRRYHTIGLDKPIAHLNKVVRNDFILIDGICGDLDFEEGGNPLYSGRLIAARDPVLCDAWAAAQIGYTVREIPYIGIAEKLGIGCADIGKAKIRELNKADSQKQPSLSPTGKIRRLAVYTEENNACSACFASLIYALSHTDTGKLKSKICVGQGFKGKQGNTGVGNCCSGFKYSCAGCPPSGADILSFLRNL